MSVVSWEPWIEDMRRIHDSIMSTLELYRHNPESSEVMSKLKIELHSMKGLLDAVGFNTATETVVEIEDMVHSSDSADEKIMEIMDGLTVKMDNMIKLLEGEGEKSVSEIDKKIGFETLLVKAGRRMTLEIEINEKKSMMSSRAMSIINSIKKIAVVEDVTPSLDDLALDAKFDLLKIEITTHENKDLVKDQIEKLPKIKSVSIFTTTDTTASSAEELYLRIKLKDVRSIGDDLTILAGLVSQLENHLSSGGMDILNSVFTSIENIQDDLRRLKSVPLIEIFSGLPGMVSRIAKQEKKMVDFSMQGRFIRVDKSVANSILEPITQMIRNAVSHGIEPRATRKKLKKSPIGSITLSATEVRDKVIIKVSDDGAGIDPKGIQKKAKELGLDIKSENIYDVLFENRFTTHKDDASISGRGIGLYTTKKRIERVGGTISVKSEVGKGTVFTIEIPNTDALLKSLIVRTGDMKFAVSSNDIEHLEVIEKSIGESYHYIDREIPIVHMAEVLNAEKRDSQQILLVCRGSQSYFALIVDEVIDEKLTSIKPLNPLLANLKIFDGTLFDEKQEPILVLKTTAIA